MTNNIFFSEDPFEIFSRSTPSSLGSTSSSSKSGSSFWTIILIVLLIVGMAIIYLYRHTILKFFLGSSTPPNEVSPSVTDTVAEENNEIKASPVERQPFKLLPEHKVIRRFDLSDQDNWDKALIVLKEKEGKAVFVAGKGWLIYE
ncbi:hypothetical protein [Flectobacillus major]|uniref:hypothetical protein n=1 Tax=Flectobacillus major TaxID=103 RepID=UPI0005C51031|nr:hypothetical protein [Flectobacillus major]